MTQTMNADGRAARKSLAEQIDRLDGILDGLAEALNEAVAGAVQQAVGQAVQQAVQAVLLELATNPELQEHLHRAGAGPQPAAERRGWGSTLAAAAQVAGAGAAAAGQRAWQHTATGVGRLGSGLRRWAAAGYAQAVSVVQATGTKVRALARLVNCSRRSLLAALGIGAVIGLGCYCAGPTVAALVSGLAGFVGSLTARVLAGLHRLVAPEQPSPA